MRFRCALVIATAIILAACSQSRSSLPPASQQIRSRGAAMGPQASQLRPYGRDLMLTEFKDGLVFAVAYSPYAVTGSKPDWEIIEQTYGLSNTARDPTSNAIFWSNYQELIDSYADPATGRFHYREIATPGSAEAIQVAVDHHGTVYGLMGDNLTIPSIVGYAKGNNGGIDVPPSTTLAGPKTGLTSRPFAYSMAFDETNELFIKGDAKIRVFASPANGNIPPTRILEGPSVTPILQGARAFSVDERGDVAVIPKTAKSVVLYRAQAHGNALPIKTLSGPRTALNFAASVIYCNNDTLWVLDNVSNGETRIMLYPAGWNNDTRPTRVINVTSTLDGGFVADMSLY